MAQPAPRKSALPGDLSPRRLGMAVAGIFLFLLFGPRLTPEPVLLSRVVTLGVAKLDTLASGETLAQPLVINASGPDEAQLLQDLRVRILDGERWREPTPGEIPWQLDATLVSDPTSPQLHLSLAPPQGSRVPGRDWAVTASPPRWTSLAAPFLAILLAITLRQTILSLAAGVWVGSMLLAEGSTWLRPLQGAWDLFTVYIVRNSFFDYTAAGNAIKKGADVFTAAGAGISSTSFSLEVILFVFGLIGTVGIITRGAGIQGMMNRAARITQSVKTTLITTFAMGLAIFFDDYSNTLIVGNTMRPITDRLSIAREKLAYVVDSTAAPVAGISIFSTWVAYEISMFADQAAEVGLGTNPYAIFIETIPYRFYCILSLLMVALVVVLDRDFGPMRRAEERARSTGALTRPGSQPLVSSAMEAASPKAGIPARWANAVIPLGATLLVTVFLMIKSGMAGAGPYSGSSGAWLREVLYHADSTSALFTGAWSGFVIAMALLWAQGILTPAESMRAGFASFEAVANAIGILVLAWAIGAVCSELGTAQFLFGMLEGRISPLVFPAGLFLVSCAVSFSTGSSWSTMSIVLPNTVFLAWSMGEASPLGGAAMTIMSIGAVLEGSIFGDHCSPLSDTTILSSTATGSDHLDHVRTQMPYAVTVMVIALSCGYLPAAAGVPVWIALLAGAAAVTTVVVFAARPLPEPTRDAAQRT